MSKEFLRNNILEYDEEIRLVEKLYGFCSTGASLPSPGVSISCHKIALNIFL